MTEEVKKKPGRPKAIKEDTPIQVDEEKERMRQELEILKKAVAALQNQEQEPTLTEDSSDPSKINQDDYIKVIALCPMQLNLSTLPGGKGKIFRFRSFGDTKSIIYSSLVDIIENHQSFLEQGYYYIADKRVIRRHGLDEIYEKILSKEKMEEIIMAKSEHAVDLFKSANAKQQEFICTMLIKKMYDGEELDLNMVDAISREAGIDITNKVEEAKKFAEASE